MERKTRAGQEAKGTGEMGARGLKVISIGKEQVRQGQHLRFGWLLILSSFWGRGLPCCVCLPGPPGPGMIRADGYG